MVVILSRGILVRWHLQIDQYQKKADTVFVIRRMVLLFLYAVTEKFSNMQCGAVITRSIFSQKDTP